MANRKTKAEIEQELEVARHLIRDLEEGHAVNMASINDLRAQAALVDKLNADRGRLQEEEIRLRERIYSLQSERDTLRAALANLGPVLALLEASDA